MAITKEQVEQAKKEYQELLENFLIEKGWNKISEQWGDWEKNGRFLLNDEEAFYEETKQEA
jgi:hypothetical protein